ncbi:MAG: hypothetical protein KC553_08555 [Nitrospina sp.]|nr:hypothetical protein [Nitrospina sp.]
MSGTVFKFNRRTHGWTGLALLLLITGCLSVRAEPPAAKSREVLVQYSGQALGELKPCGCAKEEDQGGVERRMGFFSTPQEQGVPIVRVDLGDNFKEASRQGRLKGETMVRAMAQMNYDAVVLGEKDLVYGNSFLQELPALPWTSANVQVEGWKTAPYIVKRFPDGLTIGLISVAEPELLYAGHDSGIQVLAPKKALDRWLPKLKAERPDLVVLLTHMEKESALELLNTEGVDLVINGHIKNDQHLVDFTPQQRDGKFFAQPGPRGQKLGNLRITLNPDGTKAFAPQIVALDSKVPSDPGMTALYEQYNAGVEELFLESLKARRGKMKSVYATDTACKTCHAEAHEKWEQSRHGHAYNTLKKVNKAFDPECLVCHTTGFNKTGGFLSEVDTPELENVQCEVCHGPRREHAQSPSGGFAKEARQACGQCHVRNHSPNFDYTTYWPRIAH